MWFAKGNAVEVTRDEEGLTNAWFRAKILKSPPPSSSKIKKGKVLVEFETLLAHDEKSPLQEFVDVSFIRPLPSVKDSMKLQSFGIFDVVDAFYRDGWWKGVISTVNEQDNKNEKRYTVVFENPPDQIGFVASSLRFHLDWNGDSWVRPEKQMRMTGLKFSVGMSVLVNLDEANSSDDWFPAVVLEEVGFNSFLVMISNSSNKDDFVKSTVDSFHIRPPLPQLEYKKFELLEKVYVFYHSSWKPGFIYRVLSGGRFTVLLLPSKEEKEFSLSDIRPHMNFKNGNWDTLNARCAQEQSSLASPEVAIRLKSPSASLDDVEENTPCTDSGKNLMQKSTISNATHPRIRVKHGACCKEKRTRLDSTPIASLPSKKLRVDHSANHLSHMESCAKSMLIANEGAAGTVTSRTKHSTPQEAYDRPLTEDESLFRQTNDETDQHETGVEHEMRVSVVEERIPSYSQVEAQLVQTAGTVMLQTNRQEIGVDEETMIFVEEERTPAHLPVKQLLDPTSGDENVYTRGDSAKAIGWSVSASDCQDEDQLILAAGEEDNVAGGGVSDMEIEYNATEVVELPFAKSSPLWQGIESLQVFQSIPQNPHFCPLVKCKELDREGLAVGQMVKFLNLVEKTSQLRVDSPHDDFDAYLEALSELKIYGFYIKPVVHRLKKLLSIKDRRLHFQDQSKKVQIQIANCAREKSQVEENVSASEKQISKLLSKIRELEERLCKAEEIQARYVSAKEMKDSEITNLQNESSAISDNIVKADQEFRRLAAASW